MRTISIVAFLILMAGCADSTPAVQPDDGLGTQEVEAGDDTGAISGVVVDPTITPIAGALVSLLGQELSVETNEKGQFVFEDLAPGTYFVSASAVGHTDAQTGVDVVAGEVAKPRLQLQIDATPQPYKETQDFRGHMVFSDILLVYVLTDIIGDNDLCRCSFELTSEAGVTTTVVDTVYESSYTRVEEHDMYWDVWGGDGHASRWIMSEDAWHVSGDQFTGATDWRFLISSGEQPDVEQSFEGYITFWYVEAAPTGWTFLEDG